MTENDKRFNPRFSDSDKQLFETAKDFACDYMSTAYDRHVNPTDQAIDDLNRFQEPLPANMCSAHDLLKLLHDVGSPASVTVTGGRYFGFVNGSSYPAALAAKWLSAVWDQNPALYVISPIVSKLEEICEQWLVELFGLPEETVAGLVSGTSTATMCGLAAGRLELFKRQGWDVNQKGIAGAPPIRVVAGTQAHATVFKALALLGFGRENIETVPVDDQGRMISSQLPELDDKTLLIVQAGNVNSGAFDPLEEICDKANKAEAWVHIDGAFGLWAEASGRFRHLTKGLEKADSWSVDGHKTLNTPYDCGIVLCKHPEVLVEAMQASGSYIQYGEHRDSMLYTPEMSRRSRAVELWATMKYLGRKGIEELVDRLCDNAQELADQLKTAGFTIHNDVVFNQVLVSCETSDQTTATLANIQSSGDCWCGGSTWNDRPVIRISVCSWKTAKEDIEKTVACFIKSRKKAIQQQ
ncbi:MAG: aminotransferase class V-fold PLP-dependent enzyme [Proteobacteria bacterium]|nr:aminotransferase class V-fold PLP-dependent enzyme [Pseudomonadota bacterium]